MLSEFLTWGSWDELDALSMCLYDVEVVKDFGQMKKGDLYPSISVFYDTGLIEVYKEENKPAFTLKIKIQPA